MADPLLTLADYKSLMGVQNSDTRKDPHITALLPAASMAVRTYTGRSFEVAAGPPSAREYQYDGSGVLDIDDATAVSGISTNSGVVGQSYALASEQWTAMPQDDSEVFHYLMIHGGPYFSGSPEMGFRRNLDQYPWLAHQLPLLAVTASWGWPQIPADVKLAAALTISDWVAGAGPMGAKPEGLTSEAISGFARSWGARNGTALALAVPNRARDLLVNYQRIFV